MKPRKRGYYCVSYFKSRATPGNLTSTLIKIRILEKFCSIICYEFVMLKNGMQYRARYLVVLLWISNNISDIEKSAGYAGYQIFFGYPVHP